MVVWCVCVLLGVVVHTLTRMFAGPTVRKITVNVSVFCNAELKSRPGSPYFFGLWITAILIPHLAKAFDLTKLFKLNKLNTQSGKITSFYSCSNRIVPGLLVTIHLLFRSQGLSVRFNEWLIPSSCIFRKRWTFSEYITKRRASKADTDIVNDFLCVHIPSTQRGQSSAERTGINISLYAYQKGANEKTINYPAKEELHSVRCVGMRSSFLIFSTPSITFLLIYDVDGGNSVIYDYNHKHFLLHFDLPATRFYYVFIDDWNKKCGQNYYFFKNMAYNFFLI